MIPVALQVLWRFAAGSRRWRMPVLLREAYHVSWALEPLCAARLWLVLQLCVHTHPCDAESGVCGTGREHHSVVPHRTKRLCGAAAQEVLAFCSAPECTGARFAICDRSVRSAQGLGACFSKQKCSLYEMPKTTRFTKRFLMNKTTIITLNNNNNLYKQQIY